MAEISLGRCAERQTDSHVAQRSATTAGQKSILTALGLAEPPKDFDFTTST
jgi:hypothetical protein